MISAKCISLHAAFLCHKFIMVMGYGGIGVNKKLEQWSTTLDFLGSSQVELN